MVFSRTTIVLKLATCGERRPPTGLHNSLLQLLVCVSFAARPKLTWHDNIVLGVLEPIVSFELAKLPLYFVENEINFEIEMSINGSKSIVMVIILRIIYICISSFHDNKRGNWVIESKLILISNCDWIVKIGGADDGMIEISIPSKRLINYGRCGRWKCYHFIMPQWQRANHC